MGGFPAIFPSPLPSSPADFVHPQRIVGSAYQRMAGQRRSRFRRSDEKRTFAAFGRGPNLSESRSFLRRRDGGLRAPNDYSREFGGLSGAFDNRRNGLVLFESAWGRRDPRI